MDTLLALAVLPAAALLYYVYKQDPVEKEPYKLLGMLLVLGMVSTLPAIWLEQLGTEVFLRGYSEASLAYLVVDNFLVVALVEELCKYFFLRFKTWNSPAFDYMFDGIVYAVFVSLGFAIAENIAYVFEYGFATGVVRAFTAIPGHCIFAVFMGFFYGRAKWAQSQGKPFASLCLRVAAVVVPVFCHGFYDFWASIDGCLALCVFFAFLAAMVFTGYQLVKQESALARRIDA